MDILFGRPLSDGAAPERKIDYFKDFCRIDIYLNKANLIRHPVGIYVTQFLYFSFFIYYIISLFAIFYNMSLIIYEYAFVIVQLLSINIFFLFKSFLFNPQKQCTG